MKRRSRGILRRRGGADAAAPAAAAAAPKQTTMEKLKAVAKTPPGQFLLTELGKEIKKRSTAAGLAYSAARTYFGVGRHRPHYSYTKTGPKRYISTRVPKGHYYSRKHGVKAYKKTAGRKK